MSEALSAAPSTDKVAPFLIKLFEIVSSAASDDLVCWSEHGETWIVARTKLLRPVGRMDARRASARQTTSPHTPSACGSPRHRPPPAESRHAAAFSSMTIYDRSFGS